jgi:hypothetical protein
MRRRLVRPPAYNVRPHRPPPVCRRRLRICARVAPWVPLLATLMIATGLPVWAVYTRRALDTTRAVGDALFGARTIGVDQLIINTQWTTGLAVIIVSSVVGCCALLSLLRTYQEAAAHPGTACGPPGKLSYGAYAALISFVTFALWLVAIAVALLIAAQLCWLLLAFVFEAALLRGVE